MQGALQRQDRGSAEPSDDIDGDDEAGAAGPGHSADSDLDEYSDEDDDMVQASWQPALAARSISPVNFSVVFLPDCKMPLLCAEGRPGAPCK